MSVFFIAEAGVNHNGIKDMAFRLIDAALASGADAVKFQTFNAEALASSTAPKAAYQNKTTNAAESQLDMLRRLELPRAWHAELMAYCDDKGIVFLSTPFDSQSLTFLSRELGVETIKVPSGEVTNGPFLLEIARTGCDIILSTGMSTLDEVRTALGVLAFGLIDAQGTPSMDGFKAAFESADGQAALKLKVTVLHCTSAYPTPLTDANVRAMVTIRDTFGLKTGFSDHTEGDTASLAAAALGADVIEKHFTLDRSLPGPDHKASLEPEALGAMIQAIRSIETALGNGIKAPREIEADTRRVVRKSLTALEDIAEGTVLSSTTLGAMRPGSGMSPMHFWEHIGHTTPRALKKGELL